MVDRFFQGRVPLLNPAIVSSVDQFALLPIIFRGEVRVLADLQIPSTLLRGQAVRGS